MGDHMLKGGTGRRRRPDPFTYGHGRFRPRGTESFRLMLNFMDYFLDEDFMQVKRLGLVRVLLVSGVRPYRDGH